MNKKILCSLVLLFAGFTSNSYAEELNTPSSSEVWVCKTSPIWNGRASYPRFATGQTKDEAFQGAVAFCASSGQASYCESQINCWTQD